MNDRRVGSVFAGLVMAVGAIAFSPSAAASTSPDDPLLAQGTYRSGEITRDELIATGVAAGFSAEEVERFLDDIPVVDHVEIGHRLANGEWSTTVAFDGDPGEVATRGTYEVVDVDTAIAPGICGGPVTVDYAIDGDGVTFEVIDDDCDGVDRLVDALNFESTRFIRSTDDAAPVSLVFGNAASHGFPFGTDRYFEEVERLSGGTITVVSDGDNRDGDPQPVQSLVDDVRSGVDDIAILGPGDFSTFGLDRVAALVPPMLIDSYVLEREIFARGLHNRLLGGLDELGVVGVAVLPGPLQKLVGFDQTFRTLEDFGGAVVGGMRDDVAGALGATTATHVGGTPFTGFDGNVMSVGGMSGRHVDQEAEAVTATGNINMFAVPWIVIVNPDTYASLDADQQAALRDAGPASVDAVLETIVADQGEALQLLCAVGVEFVTMSDDDLADIRTALDAIYADLAADPEVAAYIDEVEQFKAELGVGPDAATCPAATVESTEAARIPGENALPEGLYRTRELTGDELIATAIAAGAAAEEMAAEFDAIGLETAVYGLRLANGVWTQTESHNGGPEVVGWRLTYEFLDEDTVIVSEGCSVITYTYTFDGEALTIDVVDDKCDGVDDEHDLIWQTLIHESAPFVLVDEGDASTTVGSGWTHTLGDAARSGAADAGPTGEPVELWRFQAEGDCEGAPIVVGETAFVACRDGNLYALSVTDRSEAWRFRADAPFPGGLAAAEGLVYTADETGTLYAVEMATGSEVWRLDATVATAPAVADGLLAVGTGDGALVGLEPATGDESWRYVVGELVGLKSPAIANGLVYAGSEAAGLTAVNASTGELVWQSDTGGPTGSVRVIDGIAYVGCRDGNATPLSAFDADTGDLLWRKVGGCDFPPAVVDGVAYSGGEPGDVYAFDTSDGSELWHVAAAPGSEVSQAPVVADGIVYVVTNDVDAVFAYDAATGEQLWRYDVHASHAAPAVAGGRLYTTDAGDVIAIGGSDQVPDAAPARSPATDASSDD